MTSKRGGILVAALALATVALGGCGRLAGAPGRMQTSAASARARAERVLYKAAASSDGQLRARAVESLAMTEAPNAGRILMAGLNDGAVAVQFASAMGIGDLAYAPAMEKLQAMADDPDTDKNVLCGVIYALHRLGDDSRAPLLGPMLYDASAEVRANSAMAMGKFGSDAAIGPLSSRMDVERNRGVRLQIAESLAKLGDERSYGILMNFAHIGEPHERMAAVAALGRAGGPRAKHAVLWAIDETQPPLLRLVAGGALGQLGDSRAYWMLLSAIEDPEGFSQLSSDKPVSLSVENVQQLQSVASLALGHVGETAAVDVLTDLLDSPNPTVAVSAAQSILMLLSQTPQATAAAAQPPAVHVQAADDAVAEAPADDEADASPATQPAPAMRTAPMRD